jgi:thiamine pyrophosphokinase
MQAAQPAVQRLDFDTLMVAVGGGSVDSELLRELYASGGHLVAADGGADRIVAAGLKPEVIIGDFDSLSNPFTWLGKAHLMQIAEQETTDFEKVLYSTRAPVTVALGMTGGRFDHTLAALDAVARHAAERRIVLVDEEDIALGLVGPIRFTIDPGARVSVHPLAPVSFARSEGLDYPLDGLLLAPGVRTGTSNSTSGGTFSITPVPGNRAPYLLILPRVFLAGLVSLLLHQAQ